MQQDSALSTGIYTAQQPRVMPAASLTWMNIQDQNLQVLGTPRKCKHYQLHSSLFRPRAARAPAAHRAGSSGAAPRCPQSAGSSCSAPRGWGLRSGAPLSRRCHPPCRAPCCPCQALYPRQAHLPALEQPDITRSVRDRRRTALHRGAPGLISSQASGLPVARQHRHQARRDITILLQCTPCKGKNKIIHIQSLRLKLPNI